jgi:catechol 2,3-dioxygenase-like lactoylglutathione lyase family enzyme
MARVQLALNVSDLDRAVDFYSKMFDTPPNKVKDGYANFAVEDPPLKLVLIEHADATERLNHLGVELQTTDEVGSATERLRSVGLDTTTEDQTTCCYAVQDKVWVDDPQGSSWEFYAILEDAEQFACVADACSP